MGQARDLAEKFFDLFAAGEMNAAMALFDPACITLMPTGPLTQAEHEAMGNAFKAGLPDCRMVVENAVEAGDEVVILGRFRGTHSGNLQSPGGTLPASGRSLDLRFMDYFRVEDGRIVDHQTVFDQMDMLAQLGALPVA